MSSELVRRLSEKRVAAAMEEKNIAAALTVSLAALSSPKAAMAVVDGEREEKLLPHCLGHERTKAVYAAMPYSANAGSRIQLMIAWST